MQTLASGNRGPIYPGSDTPSSGGGDEAFYDRAGEQAMGLDVDSAIHLGADVLAVYDGGDRQVMNAKRRLGLSWSFGKFAAQHAASAN